MTEDDFQKVIDRVQIKLIENGKSHLADPELYIDYNDEDDERRRISKFVLLLQMLKAFDRELALENRAIVEQSLSIMREATYDESAPGFVAFLPTPFEGDDVEFSQLIDTAKERDEFVDLRDAEDRSELRSQVQRLIGRLAESNESKE